MRRKMLLKTMQGFLLLGCLVLSFPVCFAQDTDRVVKEDTAGIFRIVLRDDSYFIGKIVADDSAHLVIITQSNTKIEIPRNQILTIEPVEAKRIVNGKFIFPNPNATRYLFGPSAFPLKKKEGYYQNIYIIGHVFNVGITDHISIGGGLEIITPFVENELPVFMLMPKVGFRVTEKLYAGGGLMYAHAFDEDLGIAYGVGTWGTIERNMTLGLGYMAADEMDNRPIIMLSGTTRVSKRISLVSENWIFLDPGYAFYSYGIRIFSEKIAVDIAFINNGDIIEEIPIGIPYLDFVVKF
jgi:hypothetical protein